MKRVSTYRYIREVWDQQIVVRVDQFVINHTEIQVHHHVWTYVTRLVNHERRRRCCLP